MFCSPGAQRTGGCLLLNSSNGAPAVGEPTAAVAREPADDSALSWPSQALALPAVSGGTRSVWSFSKKNGGLLANIRSTVGEKEIETWKSTCLEIFWHEVLPQVFFGEFNFRALMVDAIPLGPLGFSTPRMMFFVDVNWSKWSDFLWGYSCQVSLPFEVVRLFMPEAYAGWRLRALQEKSDDMNHPWFLRHPMSPYNLHFQKVTELLEKLKTRDHLINLVLVGDLFLLALGLLFCWFRGALSQLWEQRKKDYRRVWRLLAVASLDLAPLFLASFC